jgi:hypothetical protein
MKIKQYISFLVLFITMILISSCSDASAGPSKVWRNYENQQYGYAFNYPSDCTYGPLPQDCKSAPPEEQRPACLCFLNPENPDQVLMQTFQSEDNQLVLAEFFVARLNAPADNSLDETRLTDWLAENFPEKWEHAEIENIKIDGVSAVSISSPTSKMAPAIKEIYFMHNGHLFQISMLNPNVEISSKLYERILASFRFDGQGG